MLKKDKISYYVLIVIIGSLIIWFQFTSFNINQSTSDELKSEVDSLKIEWSFIPILNFISIIVLIVVSLVLIGDSYNNSFEKAFGETSKLNKFIKFLNKKL